MCLAGFGTSPEPARIGGGFVQLRGCGKLKLFGRNRHLGRDKNVELQFFNPQLIELYLFEHFWPDVHVLGGTRMCFLCTDVWSVSSVH